MSLPTHEGGSELCSHKALDRETSTVIMLSRRKHDRCQSRDDMVPLPVSKISVTQVDKITCRSAQKPCSGRGIVKDGSQNCMKAVVHVRATQAL